MGVSRRLVELAVTGGLVLLVLVALGVASGDVVTVWTDPPSTATIDTIVIEPTGTTLVPPDPAATLTADVVDDQAWVLRVAAVIGLVALCWLAVVVVVTWWRIWRERTRRSPPSTPTAQLQPLTTPHVELAATALADALRDGEPRNAIVACWIHLEEIVAAAGHPRQPAETSADYTARVLTAASNLDPDAVEALARLYREARFSSHPLGEAHRAAAIEALATVVR